MKVLINDKRRRNIYHLSFVLLCSQLGLLVRGGLGGVGLVEVGKLNARHDDNIEIICSPLKNNRNRKVLERLS